MTPVISIIIRRPDGTLEPLADLKDREVTALTIQAGLLGLRREEWLAVLLRRLVALRPSPAPAEMQYSGSIVVDLPYALAEALSVQRLADEGKVRVTVVTHELIAAACGGNVLAVEHSVQEGQGELPDSAADQALSLVKARFGFPTTEYCQMSEWEDNQVAQQLAAGEFTAALARGQGEELPCTSQP